MAGVNESFGESVALFVSISVGGGGLSFRSPVVWQLVAADLLFLFLLRGDVGSTLVDGLSALMIRLWPCGEGNGCCGISKEDGLAQRLAVGDSTSAF
jgi:hypothetical protein